jgi:hypothetical protein
VDASIRAVSIKARSRFDLGDASIRASGPVIVVDDAARQKSQNQTEGETRDTRLLASHARTVAAKRSAATRG